MEIRRKKSRIMVIAMILMAMFITTAVPGFATAPKKEDVKYLGKGRVEVEFTKDVYYKKAKVVVKDTSGKAYTASIYEKDEDELKFKVNNYKAGTKYNFTISGVKVRGTKYYGNVSGTFTIKSVSKVKIEDVKYLGKGRVEVDFTKDVYYKNAKVTVKDTSGKKYTASIYEKDEDELKFKVNNYKAGTKYNFTISGVKARGAQYYGSVSGTFTIKAVSSGNITAAKAKKIALDNAKLKESQVYDMEVDKERERGVTFYEVSFETKKYEYEYHISLKGKILYKEVERD